MKHLPNIPVYLILFICSIFTVGQLHGQSEADWWYFGNQAGVHFTPGGPVADLNGQMNTGEGCTAVSDASGNLLFYSDGSAVYNAAHNIMPNGNGLNGSSTSTQSGVACPYPGNSDLYYLFTVDFQGNPNGLKYSLIDMTLNGGMGDVVAAQKNVALRTPVTEKITSVGHANGTDYWVMAHDYNSDAFIAYHISSTGINTTPVVSNVGTVHNSTGIGYLKASPNGARLANAITFKAPGIIEIFDFNNAIGTVSNTVSLSPYADPYGVEFSTTGELLYVSMNANADVVQFDLNAGSAAQIMNSAVNFPISGNPSSGGALQLGPDDKIYYSIANSTHLHSFQNPDVIGVGANYVNNTVDLLGKVTVFGLPTFVQSFFNVDLTVKEFCLGDSTRFIFSSLVAIDSVFWDFGDPLSGLSNFSDLLMPKHQFTNSGIFTVTITVWTGGISNVVTKKVKILIAPDINLGPDTSVCQGTDLKMLAFSTYMDTVYYNWTSNLGLTNHTIANPSVTVDSSVTYIAAIINTKGCAAKDTINITAILPPVVSGVGDTTICEGDSIQINASGAHTWRWAQNMPLSCYTCPNPLAFPTVSTLIAVKGLDTIVGCEGIGYVKILVDPKPNVAAGTGGDICPGESVILQASGAATYQWSPGAGLSDKSIANPVATPTVSTIYTVTGTDTNGCEATDIAIVNLYPLPQFTLTPASPVICKGDTVELKISGASTYKWSPAGGLSQTAGNKVQAFPGVTKTYSVKGTDFRGCENDTTITVAVNSLPLITGTSTGPVCPGETSVLTVQGGLSYTWSPSTGLNTSTGPQVSATLQQTQTYTVTGTDINGCVAEKTITATVHPQPQISAGPDAGVCANDSARLSGSGGVIYNWQPSIGMGCINCPSPRTMPPVNTQYILIATDANGCTGSDTAMVGLEALPVVTASADQVVCKNDTALISASGAVTYKWSPAGLNGISIGQGLLTAPGQTTDYTVTGYSLFGCKATDTVQVVVTPLPQVSVSNDTGFCIGQGALLNASGALSYNWSPALGLSGTSGAQVNTTPQTTTIYTVVGTDATGCKNTAAVTVTVNQLPLVTVSADTGFCSGQSVNIQAMGAGNYAWSPSTGLNTASGPSVTANHTSTMGYTVTGTDLNGCENKDSLIVTVYPLPTILASNDISFCKGGAGQVSATGANSYSWSPGMGLSGTTGANLTASPLATTTYTVTGTDVKGCENRDSVSVTVFLLPNVMSSPDVSFCKGLSGQISASGAVSYSWSPAIGLQQPGQATTVANPQQSITYTVTGTDANGCMGIDSVTLTVFALPVVLTGDSLRYCEGGKGSLSATGASTYSWDPATDLNNPAKSNPVTQTAVSRTYTVTGTDANGCTDTETQSVTVLTAPNVKAGPDITVFNGQSTVLNGSGAANYSWSPTDYLSDPDAASPGLSPGQTITYILTGTDADGCINYDTVTVTVKEPKKITVPNAFTPNGDGKNDLFIISADPEITIEQFMVYNRWGEQIFETRDPLEGWDGTYNGLPQPLGSYVYVVHGRDVLGMIYSKKGNVTLIR